MHLAVIQVNAITKRPFHEKKNSSDGDGYPFFANGSETDCNAFVMQ